MGKIIKKHFSIFRNILTLVLIVDWILSLRAVIYCHVNHFEGYQVFKWPFALFRSPCHIRIYPNALVSLILVPLALYFLWKYGKKPK